MEATGGYENQLVQVLHKNSIALAVVNPRRVRDFAKGIGIDAKTDPIDAGVIAYYGEVAKPAPQPAKSKEAKKLVALVEAQETKNHRRPLIRASRALYGDVVGNKIQSNYP